MHLRYLCLSFFLFSVAQYAAPCYKASLSAFRKMLSNHSSTWPHNTLMLSPLFPHFVDLFATTDSRTFILWLLLEIKIYHIVALCYFQVLPNHLLQSLDPVNLLSLYSVFSNHLKWNLFFNFLAYHLPTIFYDSTFFFDWLSHHLRLVGRQLGINL